MGIGCSDRVTPQRAGRADAAADGMATDSDAGSRDPDEPTLVEAVTFADVHPTLREHCGGSDCHSRTDAPRPGFAVADRGEAFEETKGFSRRMVEAIESGYMPLGRGCGTAGVLRDPPPEGCLSAKDRERIGNWVAQGAVE